MRKQITLCSCVLLLLPLFLLAQSDDNRNDVLPDPFFGQSTDEVATDTEEDAFVFDDELEEEKETEETPYGLVYLNASEMPYFGNCDEQDMDNTERRTCSNLKLVEFIKENLKYPKEAKEKNIQGIVLVSFIIDETGKILAPKVVRDIGGGCGAEGLRVLKSMPRWAAAKEADEKVKVKLQLPLRFNLKTDGDVTKKYKITWGGFQKNILTKEDVKENSAGKIIVRDRFGNEIPITAMTMMYEKRNNLRTANSNGVINKKMRQIFAKAKTNSQITFLISIQDKKTIAELEQVYQIIKPEPKKSIPKESLK